MLTLDQARAIVDGALDAAFRDGVPPLGVVVLDEGGALVMAVRQDGASMFRIDVATGKAWGAVAMGVTSRALFERAKANPVFFTSLASTAGGRLLAQPGAVLVKDGEGSIIGAVGASGGSGDQDEACCAAGVRAAGFDPGLD
jgi:uncharacterized protein GlcG (DUF336 family)